MGETVNSEYSYLGYSIIGGDAGEVPPYRFPKTIFSDHSDKLTGLLREARTKAGLTQVQAAKRLGCRQTFLSKIECGERRLDVAEFSLICLAYGIRPGALLDRFVAEAKLKMAINPRNRTVAVQS